MELTPYRLPDGRVVMVDASAAKDARIIGFTLADGSIVDAIQVRDEAEKISAHLKLIAEMTQIQACSLWRFGKSGHLYLGGDDVLTAAFTARFKELGGFTPEISKALGR